MEDLRNETKAELRERIARQTETIGELLAERKRNGERLLRCQAIEREYARLRAAVDGGLRAANGVVADARGEIVAVLREFRAAIRDDRGRGLIGGPKRRAVLAEIDRRAADLIDALGEGGGAA